MMSPLTCTPLLTLLLILTARADDDGFPMWGFGGYGGDSGEWGGGGGYNNYYNAYPYYGNNIPYHGGNYYGYQQQQHGGPQQISYNNHNPYGQYYQNSPNYNPYGFYGGMGGDDSGEGLGAGFNWNNLYGGYPYGGDSSMELGDGGWNWNNVVGDMDDIFDDDGGFQLIFNNGGGNVFPTPATRYPTPPTRFPTPPTKTPIPSCKQPMDVIVLADVSQSVAPANFQAMKAAILRLADDMVISDLAVHMGVITFSDQVQDVIDLDDDAIHLRAAISALTLPKGGTNIAAGLDKVVDMFAHYGRRHVPRTCIVITDGRSQHPDETKMAAERARQAGISLFPVGIGAMVSMSELMDLADDLSDVLSLEEFDDLAPALLGINQHICPPVTPVNPKTTTTTTPRPPPPSTTTTTAATTTTTTRRTTTSTTPPPHTTPTIPTTPKPQIPDICSDCEIINGIGYKAHWSDCSSFIQCIFKPDGTVTVYIKTCQHGTWWDQKTLTCSHAKNVDCPYDRCKMPGYVSYPSATNCRGYWLCVNGKSEPRCCPPKHSYDVIKGCVPDPTCLDECGDKTETEDLCDKRAVPGRPLQFEQYVDGRGWMMMTCAFGTAYNVITCQCSDRGGDKTEIDCRPELYIPFNGDIKDESGNNNYLQVDGVTVVNGAGYFDGMSLIRVPRFSNLDYGDTVIIKLRYKEEGGGAGGAPGIPQALVANGDCNNPSSLYMVTGSGQVDMGIRTDGGQNVSISIPTTSTGWKEAVLMIDKALLLASLNGVSYQTLFSGSLESSKCALQIGRGTEFKHFIGYMDDITVYLCKPKGF